MKEKKICFCRFYEFLSYFSLIILKIFRVGAFQLIFECLIRLSICSLYRSKMNFTVRTDNEI